jgi:hypothetical protein
MFHQALKIVNYRYGGIYERGSREYTLDDFYALQLDKLDRFHCLKKSDVVIPDGMESSSEEDEGDDDDDDDDEVTEDGADDEDGAETLVDLEEVHLVGVLEVKTIEEEEPDSTVMQSDVHDVSQKIIFVVLIEISGSSRTPCALRQPPSWAYLKTLRILQRMSRVPHFRGRH